MDARCPRRDTHSRAPLCAPKSVGLCSRLAPFRMRSRVRRRARARVLADADAGCTTARCHRRRSVHNNDPRLASVPSQLRPVSLTIEHAFLTRSTPDVSFAYVRISRADQGKLTPVPSRELVVFSQFGCRCGFLLARFGLPMITRCSSMRAGATQASRPAATKRLD